MKDISFGDLVATWAVIFLFEGTNLGWDQVN